MKMTGQCTGGFIYVRRLHIYAEYGSVFRLILELAVQRSARKTNPTLIERCAGMLSIQHSM